MRVKKQQKTFEKDVVEKFFTKKSGKKSKILSPSFFCITKNNIYIHICPYINLALVPFLPLTRPTQPLVIMASPSRAEPARGGGWVCTARRQGLVGSFRARAW
jgi:hypothetical protein